jgi:chemotaxis protein MotB
MLPARLPLARLCAACTVFFAGCTVISNADLTALHEQNRTLQEKARSSQTQAENLRYHSRDLENQLQRTEEELAVVKEKGGLERKQLANFQRERDQLTEQFNGVVNARRGAHPEVNQRLAALAQKYPCLKFDPQTGIAKLDTDILFDTGGAELSQASEKKLAELTRILFSPEGHDLKVMVVGHTDDRAIARRPAREKYPNNFYLSTDRALAVCDALRRAGLEESRMGVAGYAGHEPIASNDSPKDRQKNRRVELFVMAPDVPVVGWVDSTPGIY